jgi:5'-nucleotidase
VPAGASCNIGAVYDVGSTATLTASKKSVADGSESSVSFVATLKPSLKTSVTGKVEIKSGSALLCTAVLHPLLGSATHLSTGTCSIINPSALAKGSHSVMAVYLGSGDLGPSTSSAVTLKIT